MFQNCVEEIKAEGRTVLLSSYIFSEVQRLRDAVTIVRKGQTVEVSVAQVEADLETRAVLVTGFAVQSKLALGVDESAHDEVEWSDAVSRGSW